MGHWCDVVNNGDGEVEANGIATAIIQSSHADNGNCSGGGQRYRQWHHGGVDVDSRHINIKKHIMCLICLCLCCNTTATCRHAKPWNIVIIFTDMMYDNVGEHADLSKGMNHHATQGSGKKH